MEDNSVDAVITDPPYGVLAGHRIETKIDFQHFFQECFRILKKEGCLVFFGVQPSLSQWVTYCINTGFKYKNEIIWFKRAGSSRCKRINKLHENIIIFGKGGFGIQKVKVDYVDLKCSLAEYVEVSTIRRVISALVSALKNKLKQIEVKRYLENPKPFYTQTMTTNDEYHLWDGIKSPKRHLGNIKTVLEGAVPPSVVSFLPHNKKKLGGSAVYNIKHPTVKPIPLMEMLIKLTSIKGSVVLDPFMGSGTTGLACKLLDRDFLGVECDKEYFSIAKLRIKNFNVDIYQQDITQTKKKTKNESNDNQMYLF